MGDCSDHAGVKFNPRDNIIIQLMLVEPSLCAAYCAIFFTGFKDE